MSLPKVWREPFTDHIATSLKQEAARLFRVHQLPDTLAEWREARELLRGRIWDALGVRPDHGLDLDLRETGSIAMDGYGVKKIHYLSRPGVRVTGNLYVPDGPGPFPAVINVHGHHAQGRLAEGVQARGHCLAKSGYVCLCVDAFGAGERSTEHGVYEYHGGTLGASLMNVGETLMGAQVVDNMRGVDLLCSLSCVDPARLGVTGASGGGNQTMWLAALDDRLAAAVPVVSVGAFQAYVMNSNCICEVLPGGLTFTEESGVLALTAPRALKICAGLHEQLPAFFPKEMLRSHEEAAKIWRLHGAADKLDYQIFNRPHGYWPEMREAMLGWFDLHLKGVGHGAPKAEPSYRCLPEEEVMVFAKGTRDPGVVSTAERCRREGEELRKRLLELPAIDAAAKRRELAETLKIAAPLRLKAVHRHSPRDGWERLVLETECGRMLPLLHRPGVNGDVLLAGPLDKAELEGTALFKQAAAAGKGVALLDLYATGETADDYCSVDSKQVPCRALLWLGRTMLGEWVRDFALAAAHLRSSNPGRELTLGGLKEAGLAALLTAALEGRGDVVLERAPVSLLFHRKSPPDFLSMAAYVPGFLKWGDVSLAAALAGGAVSFVAPVFSDGAELDQESMDNFTCEFALVRSRCGAKGSVLFNPKTKEL